MVGAGGGGLAGAGTGAIIGTAVLPGVGTLIGGAVGAVAGGAAGTFFLINSHAGGWSYYIFPETTHQRKQYLNPQVRELIMPTLKFCIKAVLLVI